MRLAVLGSTGSIGARTLELAALLLAFGGALALAAHDWPWAWRALIVAAFAVGLFEWARLLGLSRVWCGVYAAPFLLGMVYLLYPGNAYPHLVPDIRALIAEMTERSMPIDLLRQGTMRPSSPGDGGIPSYGGGLMQDAMAGDLAELIEKPDDEREDAEDNAVKAYIIADRTERRIPTDLLQPHPRLPASLPGGGLPSYGGSSLQGQMLRDMAEFVDELDRERQEDIENAAKAYFHGSQANFLRQISEVERAYSGDPTQFRAAVDKLIAVQRQSLQEEFGDSLSPELLEAWRLNQVQVAHEAENRVIKAWRAGLQQRSIAALAERDRIEDIRRNRLLADVSQSDDSATGLAARAAAAVGLWSITEMQRGRIRLSADINSQKRAEMEQALVKRHNVEVLAAFLASDPYMDENELGAWIQQVRDKAPGFGITEAQEQEARRIAYDRWHRQSQLRQEGRRAAAAAHQEIFEQAARRAMVENLAPQAIRDQYPQLTESEVQRISNMQSDEERSGGGTGISLSELKAHFANLPNGPEIVEEFLQEMRSKYEGGEISAQTYIGIIEWVPKHARAQTIMSVTADKKIEKEFRSKQVEARKNGYSPQDQEDINIWLDEKEGESLVSRPLLEWMRRRANEPDRNWSPVKKQLLEFSWQPTIMDGVMFRGMWGARESEAIGEAEKQYFYLREEKRFNGLEAANIIRAVYMQAYENVDRLDATVYFFLVQQLFFWVAWVFMLPSSAMLFSHSSGSRRVARAVWGVGGLGVLPPVATVMLSVPWSLVLFLILAVAVTDSAAFLVGRRFGRRLLVPRISPGKTWLGLGAGLAAAGVAGAALASLLALADTPHVHWQRVGLEDGLLFGLAIGVCVVVGGLAVSVLKRAAGTKDSGRLWPRHGGVLDRVGGFLLAAPAFMGMLALGPYSSLWDWR